MALLDVCFSFFVYGLVSALQPVASFTHVTYFPTAYTYLHSLKKNKLMQLCEIKS